MSCCDTDGSTGVSLGADKLLWFGHDLSLGKLQETHPFAQANIGVVKGKCEEFIRALSTQFPEHESVNASELNHIFIARNDHVVVYVRTGIVGKCAAFADSAEALSGFLADYDEYLAHNNDPRNVFVTCYYVIKDELKETTVAVSKDDMGETFPELYPDIDIDELIRAYGEAKDKILMLYGEPGVGKTTFIKTLLQQSEATRVAYTKDLRAIQMDAFWLQLQAGWYDYVILDDLDIDLCPRDQSTSISNQFVSKLLSFSDGVLVNTTKIIITTNQMIRNIDPAIIRPGRCFDFLELCALSPDEAMEFWVENLGNSASDFTNAFGSMVDKITQADLMLEHFRIQAQGMERTYIKKGNRRYTVASKMRDLDIAIGRREGGFVGSGT